MKIEIDLNEILGDESGVESLQQSVQRQVTEALVRITREGVDRTIKIKVAEAIEATLVTELTERMPAILDDVLNAEYVPVSRYGDPGKPTTFRAELIRTVNEQMVYKKTQFSSDANAFTKAVDGVIGDNMAEFKKSFTSIVTAQFIQDAMAHATAEMAKRLGLKAAA